MKAYTKNGTIGTNSPNYSVSDPTSPTLQDSKSATNLHK